MGLVYGLSSRIKVAFNFPLKCIPKTSLILYLADFHGLNWRIPGFDENKINIEPFSPLNPTKVCFIFIGPNSLSQAEDLSAVNHVTQAVVSWVLDWVLKLGLRNYDPS